MWTVADDSLVVWRLIAIWLLLRDDGRVPLMGNVFVAFNDEHHSDENETFAGGRGAESGVSVISVSPIFGMMVIIAHPPASLYLKLHRFLFQICVRIALVMFASFMVQRSSASRSISLDNRVALYATKTIL